MTEEILIECNVCGSFVGRYEMQRHQDFHVAEQLSQSINHVPEPPIQSSSNIQISTYSGPPGHISYLKRWYQASKFEPGYTVYLCHENTRHFGVDYDHGWGCGYRNTQMLLSPLPALGLNQFRHPPSVPDLQSHLEKAWRTGLDPMGAQQMNFKMYGTEKWLGAVDLLGMLYAWRVHGFVVDFTRPWGTLKDGNARPGTASDEIGHFALLHWMCRYFGAGRSDSQVTSTSGPVDAFQFMMQRRTGPPEIIQTQKPPLYLQYQGHSVTVVGLELKRHPRTQMIQEIRLLIFDPAWQTYQVFWDGGESSSENVQLNKSGVAVPLVRFRKTIRYLNRRQYQVVGVHLNGQQNGVKIDSDAQFAMRLQGAYDVTRIPTS